jgi:hypothetical protein
MATSNGLYSDQPVSPATSSPSAPIRVPRASYVRNEKNLGMAKNYNRHPQAGLVCPAYYVGDEFFKSARLQRCYPAERLFTLKDPLDDL